MHGGTVVDHAPVLALCRALVTAGQDPNRPLHAYRGDVLCLCVHSIGEGARLAIEDGRGSGAGEIGRKGMAQPRWFAKSGTLMPSPMGANDERPTRDSRMPG